MVSIYTLRNNLNIRITKCDFPKSHTKIKQAFVRYAYYLDDFIKFCEESSVRELDSDILHDMILQYLKNILSKPDTTKETLNDAIYAISIAMFPRLYDWQKGFEYYLKTLPLSELDKNSILIVFNNMRNEKNKKTKIKKQTQMRKAVKKRYAF